MGASGLGQLLVDEGLLQEFDRRTIRRTSGNQACAFAKGIVALGLFDENQLAGYLTEFTKFDRVPKDLTKIIELDAFSSIDPNLIMRLEIVPLRIEGRYLVIAIADPLDRATIRQVEFFTGYKIKPMIATIQQITDAIKKMIPSFQPTMTPLQKFLINHVDAAAYQRRVRDMADPGIHMDPPQASEPVNFEAPRSDDSEFEELSLEEDFEIESDASGRTSELDLSRLSAIEGDESNLEVETSSENVDDAIDSTENEETLSDDLATSNNKDTLTDEPELPLVASSNDIGGEDGDGNVDVDGDEDFASNLETDEKQDDLASLDSEQLRDDPDTSSELTTSPEEDDLHSVFDESIGDAIPTSQTHDLEEELAESDKLLTELESNMPNPSDEVSQLVAETLEGAENESDIGSKEHSLDSHHEDDRESAQASKGETDTDSDTKFATADDLDDILSNIPEPEVFNDQTETIFDQSGERNNEQSISRLRAVANNAISDLNRAMVSLNASTTKEDACKSFCRAIGASFHSGVLLIDQGGLIEPVCTWANAGDSLSWETFNLPDPTILSLSQLDVGNWVNKKIEGLNLPDGNDFLIHLVKTGGHHLYIAGQPAGHITEATKRHIGRMLRALAKRL